MDGAHVVHHTGAIAAQQWSGSADTIPVHGRLGVVHRGDYLVELSDQHQAELMPRRLFEAIYAQLEGNEYTQRPDVVVLGKQHPAAAKPVEIRSPVGPQRCCGGDWVLQLDSSQWVVLRAIFLKAFTVEHAP
jgi:hypothetical protein